MQIRAIKRQRGMFVTQFERKIFMHANEQSAHVICLQQILLINVFIYCCLVNNILRQFHMFHKQIDLFLSSFCNQT